jgi:hypothetical protein
MNMELRGKLAGIELGPKMQACNERERVFAFLLGSGIAESAAAAAEEAGYGRPYNQSAWQARQKERVTAAIEEVARTQFRNLVPRVIRAAERVIEDPEHKHHVPLIISLLSKLGYGERTAVDVNVSGEVQVNHTDAAIEDLRRLKSLGVPRERLLEVFGFSGLGRYEAMLAERDARAPKVIEHNPSEAAPGSIEPRHNPLDGAP